MALRNFTDIIAISSVWLIPLQTGRLLATRASSAASLWFLPLATKRAQLFLLHILDVGCRVQINLNHQSCSDYFPKCKEKWGEKNPKCFEVTVSMVLQWTKRKFYSFFFPRRDLQPLHTLLWQMGKQVSSLHPLTDYENAFATNLPTELF